MIAGSKTVEIDVIYFPDGSTIKAGRVEKIYGYPYAFHTENSYPFAEVRDEKGNVIRSINLLSAEQIIFKTD